MGRIAVEFGPGGSEFLEQRDEYGAVARRAAELRTALGSAVHRRRQHARFHHQHERHAAAGARLQRRAARPASHRRPGPGLEPHLRKRDHGQHGDARSATSATTATTSSRRSTTTMRRPITSGMPPRKRRCRRDRSRMWRRGPTTSRPTATSRCMRPPDTAVTTACRSNWSGDSTRASDFSSSGITETRCWSNRDTDDTQSVDAMQSLNTYLPGAVPTDFDARNRFLNYKRDPNTPKHQIRWNFIAELPIGRGKKLLGNSKGIAGEDGGRLAGCRRSGIRCKAGGACRPTITRRAIRSSITATSTRSRTARAARCFPGLPVFQRLHSRQPDQQRRCQRKAKRHRGRAGELQAVHRSADSAGPDGAAAERSGRNQRVVVLGHQQRLDSA